MKIAMISPEIAPFAKTGGLADVVATLSPALERCGHEPCLIMPAYRSVFHEEFGLQETGIKFTVPVNGRQEEAVVWQTSPGKNIAAFFIGHREYFDRDALYGTAQGDYPDNAARFVFFSRAALELLRRRPADIIHCHDWQSSLALAFLKSQPERYAELSAAKTVLTVHNLGFQGLFDPAEWPLLNLDGGFFTPRYLEFYGKINFLKAGIIFADKITTVSPSYAEEIMGPEQGFGLDGVLRDRARDVVGILNGVDYKQWDPEIDPFIARRYGARTLERKRDCKGALQKALGLAEIDAPLVGMICRLTAQKGIDLVEAIFDRLMERGLQMVVLGSGEPRYERFCSAAAARFPQQFATCLAFDEPLAHRIEAGADIFLMPSRYEPCGLNQMFSLKYGTIPIVRAVGGLKDTVQDYDAATGSGTGFVFGPPEPQALLGAIARAVALFQNKPAWNALQQKAMAMDFSWDRSAQRYNALYRQLKPSLQEG